MEDFDPSGSQNPWTDFDETWHDNVGGGSATWVVWANMWLVTSLSFFSFLLTSTSAQVAFLNRSARFIHQNACFRPRMCLLGVSTISDYN